jgi:mono/diheme cytochrome c family protein
MGKGLAFILILSCYGVIRAQFPLKGDPLEGRKIFIEKNCVVCHSILGAGGTLGPDLAKVGKRRSFFELAGLFLGHSPKMIESMEERGLEWPTFTADEMANLFAYLYYINYFDEPGSFERGEKIFKSKGCSKCHSVGGKGGRIGSPLDRFANHMSPIFLAEEMWNTSTKMVKMMKEMNIPIPTLEDNDLADILAYIRGMAVVEELNRQYLPPGDPRKGEKLFRKKSCSACHTVSGEGGKRGPDLERKGLNRSVSEVAGIMWNHAVKMKSEMESAGIPFPRFKGREMADLIAYLYFIHYFEERGDPEKGAIVFKEKGCVRCHGPAKIGPSLEKSPSLESPFHFAASMWNHIPTMRVLAEEKLIPWPQFRGEDMKNLVTYLRELREEKK